MYSKYSLICHNRVTNKRFFCNIYIYACGESRTNRREGGKRKILHYCERNEALNNFSEYLSLMDVW